MSHRTITDLSAYIIAGRVKAHPSPDSETAARTPALGIDDGVEAERIGFRRIFLSERWNLKEAGALLGGVGARTSRIGLATGILTAASRHPLHAAALGSTMQAAYGPRFVLGLGRGDDNFLGGSGLRAFGFQGLVEYVEIIRRLWRGETVSYEGPAGSYPRIALGDLHDGPAPEVWFGTFGLPKGAAAAAKAFDGVLLPPNFTPRAFARTRPASVRSLMSSRSNSASPPRMVNISRPCDVVVSAQVSLIDLKPASALPISSRIFNRSRVLRASRSSRVTITVSPRSSFRTSRASSSRFLSTPRSSGVAPRSCISRSMAPFTA